MKLVVVCVALVGGLLSDCAGDGSPDCSFVYGKVFEERGRTSFSSPGGKANASNCVALPEQAGQQAQPLMNCVETSFYSEPSTCE